MPARSVGGFLASSMALKLVDEAGAEKALLSHLWRSSGAGLDGLLEAALARAYARLERFGFVAPRKKNAELSIHIDGIHLTIMAEFYRYIDLRAMRRWASADTRRVVLRTVDKLFRSFWCCTFPHYLLGASGVYCELESVVHSAMATKKPDYASLWGEAIERLEYVGAHDGDEQIYGIGDRADFKRWITMQVSAVREHESFKTARPTSRVDRRRDAALLSWADRAQRLCKAWGTPHNQCAAEQGEFRGLEEQALVLCGGEHESSVINWYFEFSDDGNGELPGCAVTLDPDTGKGLVEGLLFGIAGLAVFEDLQRAMR